MKILLIIPNSKNIIRSISLGPLYIASSLRKEGFSDIKIIDARHEGLSDKQISRRIKDFSPRVVGISGLSMEATEVHKLARLAKQINTKCKVIIGGPYASCSPQAIIKDPNIDFVVIGEGERTICKLINAIESNRDVSGIDGIAFRNADIPVIKPEALIIEDLDSIAFPAWDLIDLEEYFNDLHRHSESPIPISNRIVSLFTSRGCPYRCIYCHNIFGKRIRLRSVRNVLEEIELLIERYDVEEIEIVDDCFNFDLARAKQICDQIIRRGFKINLSFPNALRVDRMDEELIIKLKKAGTHMICYAIESASPEIQRKIKKNLDLNRAKQIIDQTVNQDIIVCGYFMLGFPEETKEQMLQTIRFAKEAPFHIVNFSYVTPMPNTELFKEVENKNIELRKIGAAYFQRLSFNLSSVSDIELKRMWAKAFREFYFRPSQIWYIYKAIPDKRILLKNVFLTLRRSITGWHL